MSVTVTCQCPLCGKVSFVSCDESAWDAYEAGALAQDAFPTMGLHTRETLISGMCLPCQERFFVEDDEDECPYNGECETCPFEECPC